MQLIRDIFLVDDDVTVCHVLTVILEGYGYHVRTFPSAEAFLENEGGATEGIMLLDLRMTGMSGLELQAELIRRGIALPIIFISGCGDVRTSVEAIKAGAIDFLEKPFSNEYLLASIREAFLRVDDSKELAELRARHASLTDREQEVMQHVVSGLTNRVMAKLLSLSYRTIEVHRSRVMNKMGAKSLPNLVHKYDMCQKSGLL
jgi:FixJ family two-component response regulator